MRPNSTGGRGRNGYGGYTAERGSEGQSRAGAKATRAQAEATRLETLKRMLELQQHSQANAIRVGAPDGPLHTLADADEPLLRHLLGLPAA